MKIVARSLLLLPLLVGLASCVPPRATFNGREMAVEDATRAQYEAARDKARAGDHAKAAELYEDLARRYPRSDEAAKALYGAGRSWEALEMPLKARAAYELVTDRYPDSAQAKEAAERIEALGGIPMVAARESYEELPEEERLRAATELAEEAEAAGDAEQALYWRKEALAQARTPNQKDRAESSLRALIEGMSPMDVERFAPREPMSSAAAPLLHYQLAMVHHAHRDWEGLEAALEDFLDRFPDHPRAPEASKLLEIIANRGKVQPLKVGVVLPLSGTYQAFGKQLLDGIQLAARGAKIELVIRDDQGEPDVAAAEVERLLYEEQVIAILGGVLVGEAQAAAAKADELGIPFLTFSRAETILEDSEWVFRSMITNGKVAKALASFAIEERGMRRFAILHPDMTYGNEMRELFDKEVQELGGSITGVQEYEDKSTSFSEPIRKLVGKENLQDRPEYQRRLAEIRAQKLGARQYRNAVEKMRNSISPLIEFDAIFLPDQWRTVALVTPALAFEDVITSWCDPADVDRTRRTTGQDVKPVMLLGTNLWNHPELPTRAGKYVNCSVFVDGFWAGSQREEVALFVEGFQDAHGRTPGLLEAYGFEAAHVLRQTIERKGPETRRALVDELLQVKNLPGPMGPTTVGEDRDLQHPLFFLFVDKGAIREIDPDAEEGAL